MDVNEVVQCPDIFELNFGTREKSLMNCRFQDKHYIAFITEDKIGMTTLPLDGNPHNTTALLAHCDGASNVVACPHSRFLFTVGGKVRIH